MSEQQKVGPTILGKLVLIVFVLAQLIIFLLGWPLEWSEIIIIFVPIFLPMLPTFGVDPLFFGIGNDGRVQNFPEP